MVRYMVGLVFIFEWALYKVILISYSNKMLLLVSFCVMITSINNYLPSDDDICHSIRIFFFYDFVQDKLGYLPICIVFSFEIFMRFEV